MSTIRTQLAIVAAILLVGGGLAALIVKASPTRPAGTSEPGHADHDHGDGKDARGPHGGRLLAADDFAVEVTIYERGVAPQLRIYAYEHGEPIDPAELELEIELVRLGGRTDRFRFREVGEYLLGDGAVEEPHSFDVVVNARWRGRAHRWEYPSYEGRVELTADTARQSGIFVDTTGPVVLRTRLQVYGRVVPNEDRMAHVIPRYPGIVKEVRKRLGDSVARGETLAVIESNESLERYPVVSEISGTVIKKHISPGEFAERGEDVYIVADLGTVWIDLNVYREDFAHLRVGQTVSVDAGEGIPTALGTIDYISPFGAESTQSMLARTELPNPTGVWKPGLFVSGAISIDEVEVPVAVKAGALQIYRDWDVVFVRHGDVYEVRPVEIGRRDGDWVEILAGLEAGQQYVTQNSFVLKADLGKSAAKHEH